MEKHANKQIICTSTSDLGLPKRPRWSILPLSITKVIQLNFPWDVTTYPTPSWIVWPSFSQVNYVEGIPEGESHVGSNRSAMSLSFILLKENFIPWQIICTKQSTYNFGSNENWQRKSEKSSKISLCKLKPSRCCSQQFIK